MKGAEYKWSALNADVYCRSGEILAVSMLSSPSRPLSNWVRSFKPGKWLMKPASLARWSPGRSVRSSMKKMELLGAKLAVSDLAPAAPDSTKAPAVEARATMTTIAPATAQRNRRDGAAIATGWTPAAHPSPMATTVPWGAAACGCSPCST